MYYNNNTMEGQKHQRCRIRGVSTVSFIAISLAFYFASHSLRLLAKTPSDHMEIDSSPIQQTWERHDINNNENNENNENERRPIANRFRRHASKSRDLANSNFPDKRASLEARLQEFKNTQALKGTLRNRAIVKDVSNIINNNLPANPQNYIPKTPIYKPRYVECNEGSILDERDPSRIPGYIEGCSNSTYFGYVMRDLASRLFYSPTIPSSPPSRTAVVSAKNVLVVGSDINRTLSKLPKDDMSWDEHAMRKRYRYNVAKSFVLSALQHRHTVVGVDRNVDAWWTSSMMSNSMNSTRHANKPFFLLAIFDSSIGNEDTIIRRAEMFLMEASIKYVVFRVSSAGGTLRGVKATHLLQQAGYKVQVLSASHAHPNGGGNDTRTFPPNTLLQDNATDYLKYGSKLAENAEGPTGIFRSYLFATKGFDLAIPTQREYINVTGHTDDFILDPDDIPYKNCTSSNARLVFVHGKVKARCNGFYVADKEMQVMKNQSHFWFSGSTVDSSEAACVRCPSEGVGLAHEDNNMNIACAERFPAGIPNTNTSISVGGQGTSATTKTSPLSDLVLIHLEKMSRQQFKKSFPKTSAMLLADGFVGFDNFISMEDLSGNANYNALFGGWDGDREKRFNNNNNTNSSYHTTAGEAQWLWDAYQRQGYNVLKAGNRCVRPAEFLRSAATANESSFFGSQINEMFCFGFERPNCLGRMSTAARLFAYANKFARHQVANKIPVALFLTLVDGHEDTGMLAGALDKELSKFLMDIHQSTRRMTTNIAIVSGQGMDYGPYYTSLPGLQESIQPLFYFNSGSVRYDRILQDNKNMYATPFDVYETLLQLSFNRTAHSTTTTRTERELEDGGSTAEKRGLSLLKTLPPSRVHCNTTEEISEAHCSLLVETEEQNKRIALRMPSPPSMLSFYADIPKHQRHHVMTVDGPQMPQRAELTGGCWCATNTRKWFECAGKRHPWGTLGKNRTVAKKEYFLLVDCPGKPTHFEIDMVPNLALTNKTSRKLAQFPKASTFPNILFIELDSTSVAHSDRHFPKTRELLKRYRVKSSAEGYSCPFGFCSADFSSHATLAGASSIPNQVAALGGCLTAPWELCGLNFTTEIGVVCNDTNDPKYGLRLERARFGVKQTVWCPPRPNNTFPGTPWLPGVAEKFGYVNYFGEELCFEGSPYVTQGNVFPSFYQDVEPHLAFCRLAEQRIRKENIEIHDMFRWSLEKPEEPCVDGYECGMKKNRIALDLLESTWNTYSNKPKMAFLNSGAAHVYTYDQAKQHILAEYFDDELSTFLESMLSRSDANSTIMVIRADHGLQKGPLAMEYATQVEHNRPWTELLVPESLPGISKHAMAVNQDRLTSSHDIYRTLREAIEDALNGSRPRFPNPPIPNWSYNLLKTEIPSSRTCQDANVDSNLCRDKSIHRTFGICNILDDGQNNFCHRTDVWHHL